MPSTSHLHDDILHFRAWHIRHGPIQKFDDVHAHGRTFVHAASLAILRDGRVAGLIEGHAVIRGRGHFDPGVCGVDGHAVDPLDSAERRDDVDAAFRVHGVVHHQRGISRLH
ncbi:TPA: hypothetical protein ACIAR9_000981 [Salmonella enterica subsp. enterica serovar Poona]